MYILVTQQFIFFTVMSIQTYTIDYALPLICNRHVESYNNWEGHLHVYFIHISVTMLQQI